MAPRFVDDPTDVVLRMTMPLDQLAIPFCFFERVEVLPLDILDQRELGRGQFIDLTDNRRNAVQPCPLRCPPAALAGDDHVIVARRPKQDRLKNPAFANRIGEFVERIFIELDARLPGIRLDARNFDFSNAAARDGQLAWSGNRPCRFAEQRLQAHAKPLCRPIGAHAATASCGSRAISSRARRR